METVYGDVLFLVNFAMDFVALGITGKVIGARMRKGRITAAAMIGGVYGVAAVFLEGQRWVGMLIGIAAAALICYVAYDKRAGEALATCIAVDCMLGGAMTAAWTALRGIGGTMTDGEANAQRLTDGIPLGWLALIAGVCALAALAVGRMRKKRRGTRKKRVTVRFGAACRSFDALVDTGNLLRDPVGGLPVVLLPVKDAPALLEGDLLRAVQSGSPAAMTGLAKEKARRMRIVPARSLGGEALLLALRPDEVTVEGKEWDALTAFADLPTPLLPAECAEF